MIHKELIMSLPDELQTEIRAATKAVTKSAIDTYYARLIDRKWQELRNLEHERQEALETWIREVSGSEDSLHSSQMQEAATPTRRQMVLATLPEFSDQDFTRRDIEAKIIERWPEVEPKTDREAKNYTSGIASVMMDLAKEEQLEAKKGESRFDPRIYRLKDV